jgi:beta-1,2-mannobiose phosphorylase / 1,2-beta-oligomannan phosphorylase
VKATIRRFPENPLIVPADIIPSHPGLSVECVFNPGAFRYRGRIGLLLRVAERTLPETGWVSTPLLDPRSPSGVTILRIREDDPDLKISGRDARGFNYKGRGYLTTLSHLRLAWSDDGRTFKADPAPTLIGSGTHEDFGIEDCRVELIDGRFHLTYTAVSTFGVGCGLITTADWKTFERHGLILPPHNKDVGLFPEKIAGARWMLHRPSGLGPGGHYIWTARSPDGLHWGAHTCIATTRPGHWDSERIGAGAAPIRTTRGWLSIYHGADADGRYSLGALLLDLDNPNHVLARSVEPLMTADESYERKGFYGNTVFTNGHVIDGDRVLLYYGAADSIVCGAELSIADILATLNV